LSIAVDVVGPASVPAQAIEADAERILAELGVPDAELSVLLCDDATIHPLNRDWRGKDRATDVLAFAQREGPPIGDASILGDVVISVETAARQAEERGHDVATEVRILLVHGICHLMGYDHEDDGDAEVMEARERQILAVLADNG
jgi:probable rRNA maturation factor